MTRLEVITPIEAWASHKPRKAARAIGGKAAGLAWLVGHGFAVPRAWVIDAEPFRDVVEAVLPPGHSPRALLRLGDGAVLRERAARARDLLLGERLAPALVDDLGAVWESAAPDAPWGLAVRSSPTGEDDALEMAGVGLTRLGVRGAADLAVAVQHAWASAFSPRALAYLAARGAKDLAVAVVLQRLVVAEASGTVARCEPDDVAAARGARDDLVLTVALGLGAPVVDGVVAEDVVRVERATGRATAYVVAHKRAAWVVGREGPEVAATAMASAASPALDASLVSRVAELARKVEALSGGAPVEVGFALERGEFRVLRARSAGGAWHLDGGDATTLWSRAMFGEALPGPLTPLTWSLARPLAERGLRRALAALGCAVPRDVTLVSGLHGRLYVNVSALARVAAQLPGPELGALAGLSGVDDAASLGASTAGVSRGRAWARLPLSLARLVVAQTRLEGEQAAFEREAEEATARLTDLDLSILPDDALTTSLRDACALLERTSTLGLACTSASLASHVALRSLLARSWPVGAERLAQALVGGMRDLETAAPAVALAHVAAIARREPEVARALRGGARTPADLPESATRRALTQYLARYGESALRESELAQSRWREDPAAVVSMLRVLVAAPPQDPDAAVGRARASASRARAEVRGRASRVELALLRALVVREQRFTRLAARMRAWLARSRGTLRVVALEIDRRLLRVDRSLEPGAVFFCTSDELVAALATARPELGHLVRARRAEHARDARRADPPTTFVGRPRRAAGEARGSAVLDGLAAGAGVVEGRVRVVSSSGAGAESLLPGEVLVTRVAELGLSPLLLVAGALVTELGGPLAHAAVVARELGVPAVVNVAGATLALRDGDRVRVDGASGRVELVERASR